MKCVLVNISASAPAPAAIEKHGWSNSDNGGANQCKLAWVRGHAATCWVNYLPPAGPPTAQRFFSLSFPSYCVWCCDFTSGGCCAVRFFIKSNLAHHTSSCLCQCAHGRCHQLCIIINNRSNLEWFCRFCGEPAQNDRRKTKTKKQKFFFLLSAKKKQTRPSTSYFVEKSCSPNLIWDC